MVINANQFYLWVIILMITNLDQEPTGTAGGWVGGGGTRGP